jgi:hypothetical protein
MLERAEKEKNLLQGNMKTKDGADIRGVFLFNTILKRRLREVDKGVEVMTQRYGDSVRCIAPDGLFASCIFPVYNRACRRKMKK